MADAGKIVITPKGVYSSTSTYEWLDEVTYDGKSYIALKTVTGVTPIDDGVNWRLFLDPNDIIAGNLVPTFTEASTRSNIISEENLSTILGKVKKYFTDLKGHAFKDIVNNLTTSTTGSALDASQGKVLKDEVDELKNDLTKKRYSITLDSSENATPYSYFKSIDISEDVSNYGMPISINAKDEWSLPIPCSIIDNTLRVVSMRSKAIAEIIFSKNAKSI